MSRHYALLSKAISVCNVPSKTSFPYNPSVDACNWGFHSGSLAVSQGIKSISLCFWPPTILFFFSLFYFLSWWARFKTLGIAHKNLDLRPPLNYLKVQLPLAHTSTRPQSAPTKCQLSPETMWVFCNLHVTQGTSDQPGCYMHLFLQNLPYTLTFNS